MGAILVLAGAYFAIAKLSLLLAIPPGYATPVWPPSGIAVAALLLRGKGCWPGIWIGAALVTLTLHSSGSAALVIATGNTLEALACAALLRRFSVAPGRFERGEDVLKFFGIAAVSATVAATASMAPLRLVEALPPDLLLTNWWTSWQGDATGIIVFAPLILSWRRREAHAWTTRRSLELAGFALLLLLASLAIFGDPLVAWLPSWSLTFLALPFALWAAFRFGQREVNTSNAVLCAIAVWCTVQGQGPFSGPSPNTSLLLLLAFIATVVATGLLLSAVLAERSRAIGALQQALRHLREEAITDPLTGLYNRRFLGDYLPRELIRADRLGNSLALIMIDLDRFKQVNDTLGHAAGDRVLIEVAALLRRQIRGSDVACRYGGEEFLLVLPDATLESAQRRGEEICASIHEESERLHGVTASLGIALFPHHALVADALIRAADAALYQAKENGRDQIRVVAEPARQAPAPEGRVADTRERSAR